VITALETFLGDLFIKTLSKSDAYVQNFVFKNPKFQQRQIRLSDVFEWSRKIDTEVRAHVLEHNWHMLEESAMMYKRAFDIKCPEISATLKKGIRDRHDIVHRNGKTKDGTKGAWGLPEINALEEAVLEFAGAINEKAKALPARPSGSALDASKDPDKLIQV
jgi:hypothetical protein